MHKSTVTVIIPAAGFGKRVGSPEAKELLPDSSGRPLIDWVLSEIQARSWRAVVVTRPSKRSLIAHLKSWPCVDLMTVEQTREWPESVLVSAPYWSERNIVILPDTRFQPLTVLDQIAEDLKTCNLSLGIFSPEHFATWGVVQVRKIGCQFCEKPKEESTLLRKQGAHAWGTIGFVLSIGKQLFDGLLQSTSDHNWVELPVEARLHKLHQFIDLTRPN